MEPSYSRRVSELLRHYNKMLLRFRAAIGDERPIVRIQSQIERRATQELGVICVQATEVETSTAKASKTAGGQVSFTGLQIDESRIFRRKEGRARLMACADDDDAGAARSSAAASRTQGVS